MEFKEFERISHFIKIITTHLFDPINMLDVDYSIALDGYWDEKKLIEVNSELLDKISNDANIYMIFSSLEGSKNYCLRYIGKSKRKYARERLKNHLFKKNENTGAKLREIKNHVLNNKGTVKISWVSVEPESLRNTIEEELINQYKGADWNRENA